MQRGDIPTQAVMGVPGLDVLRAKRLAESATEEARRYAPKLTGRSALRMSPIFGEGWFGIHWADPYLWFQESGIRPFTMNSLAGKKAIPMWVDDPNGELAAKNPKAKTRTMHGGRRQTLIFRRAAKHGQRKMAMRQTGNGLQSVSIPASFPGAPGRIAVNRSKGILRAADAVGTFRNGGQIARHNVGVRWRHPGLDPGGFMARGIQFAAMGNGLPIQGVQYLSAMEASAGNYRVLVTGG